MEVGVASGRALADDVDNDYRTIPLYGANAVGGKRKTLVLRGLASESDPGGHHASPSEASQV